MFDDADLDLAADIAMMAQLLQLRRSAPTAPACSYPRSSRPRLSRKLLKRVGRIRAGDLFDKNTNFGPLVSFPHRDNVLRYIAKGKEEERARTMRR